MSGDNKNAAVDAANIGGSQAGTVSADSIPKGDFNTFAAKAQAYLGRGR